MASRRVAEADLHCYLREELKARGWGVRQLSEALGIKYGVAARWVSKDPKTRVVPVPVTLAQIASILDLDTIETFQRAGYLPILDNGESLHPHEEDIQRHLRRFRRTLRNVPDNEWLIAMVIVSVELDNLQVLLDRIGEHFPS